MSMSGISFIYLAVCGSSDISWDIEGYSGISATLEVSHRVFMAILQYQLHGVLQHPPFIYL